METKNQKVNEILTEHGLDFTIEKKPLFILDESSNRIETPYFGLINDKSKETIHVVKEGYTVSQNDEVVGMVLKGIETFGNDLTVSKAGSINGGRKIFLQLGINGTSKVGQDTIKRYITVIDSNDGTTGLSVGISDITMRCQNQFYKFYKSGQNKFRHTATIEEKLKTLPSLIEEALKESLKQIVIYNKFASTEITKGMADKMVKYVLGHDKLNKDDSELSTRSINIMDKLYADIDTEIEQVGSNMWALFGGVTRFTTHSKSSPKRDNGKIESLMLGTGYNTGMKALEFIGQETGILELV